MSLSVLNIQLSHFYTVETFASLFVVGTIYFVLRANESGRWLDHVLTGLLFGLGLASRLNVIILVVPIVIGAALTLYQRGRDGNLHSALEHTLVRLLTVFFIAALTFRFSNRLLLADQAFGTGQLTWCRVQGVQEQWKILTAISDLPWIQQWTHRSLTFPSIILCSGGWAYHWAWQVWQEWG